MAIIKDDGTVDAGFDNENETSHIPSGYSKYKRVASVQLDSNGHIRQYIQYERIFIWISPIPDVTSPSGAFITTKMTLPTRNVIATLQLALQVDTGTSSSMEIKTPGTTSGGQYVSATVPAGISPFQARGFWRGLASEGRIDHRYDSSAPLQYGINTIGWEEI